MNPMILESFGIPELMAEDMSRLPEAARKTYEDVVNTQVRAFEVPRNYPRTNVAEIAALETGVTRGIMLGTFAALSATAEVDHV